MPSPARSLVKKALVLEYVSIVWNILEGTIAIIAGAAAGSIALVGFGLDSLIEVIAAVTLVWRLRKWQAGTPLEESEAEQRARRIVGATFLVLAMYVAYESVKCLWLKEAPGASIIGMALTILASMVMPGLGLAKRHIAVKVESEALAAEAVESFVCGALSIVTLVGLGLNALWGLWWADPVVGILIAGFLIKEGLQTWQDEHD